MWNQLLHSKFVEMKNTQGESVLRSSKFTLPLELEDKIAHIFNVVELPLRQGPGAQVRKMTALEIKQDQEEATAAAAATAAATPYPNLPGPLCTTKTFSCVRSNRDAIKIALHKS